MINKEEVLKFSKALNLDPSIIEKDYVLGWLLRGIYSHREVKDCWIFKGGTSLKKCYFANYRFSEDLDFTVTNRIHSEASQLQALLVSISDWVNIQSEIEILRDSISIDPYKNSKGIDMVQATLKFNGPLRRKTNLPRVKLDFSFNELVVLEPEKRTLHHPYSDLSDDDVQISCYPFEEIFAEKIRALAERARPRDLYDIVHLYKARKKLSSKEQLLKILKEKCQFKGIPIPQLETIQTHPNKETLLSEWNSMLAHQLPQLEPFETFWGLVPTIFEWLLDPKNIE